MILDGEVDEYPEAAFNLKGNMDEVIEAGKKMPERVRLSMEYALVWQNTTGLIQNKPGRLPERRGLAGMPVVMQLLAG